MAQINVREDVSFDAPTLVEGLPGVGLVGKIATDHVVAELDMTLFASVDCDGIPQIAVYGEDDRDLRAPVRLYASEEHDLVALQSDVPISRTAASDFADCVTRWLADNDALPIYLSGLPQEDGEPSDVPELFGVATGSTGSRLDDLDLDKPPESGVVGGPTGALLNRANERSLDAIGLVVESNPQFPDPAAARQLVLNGINPLADLDVGTDALVDQAEKIRDKREKLAQRMQQAEEAESSQAQPLRMFQ
jgi:uncharacterized protein